MNSMKNKIGIHLGIFLILIIGMSYSATSIVINSQDWRDVYTGMMYGHEIDANKILYFISPNQYSTFNLRLPKGDSIIYIESSNKPYVNDYDSLLKDKGYNVTRIIKSDSGDKLAMQLGKELNKTKYFIVFDDVGYDAIIIAPYTLQTKGWVLFLNKDNVNDVMDYINQMGHYSMLFGTVEPRIADKFKPIVNEYVSEGSRFDDSIYISKLMAKEKNITYVILTNGEFIEPSLFSDKYPTLLIGKQKVPAQIVNFLNSEESPFIGGVLIGQDLYSLGKYLKDNTRLSTVIAKYGLAVVGYDEQGNEVKALRDLDKFYLPVYDLHLNIDSAKYNLATRMIEIVYHNTGDNTIYLKSNIIINGKGSDDVITTSDNDARHVYPHEYLYARYSVDLRDLISKYNQLEGKVITLYGEDYRALNLVLNKSLPDISVMRYNDGSNVSVGNVSYIYNERSFSVGLTNLWNETTYAKVKLIYTINGENHTVISNITELAGGQTKNVTIYEILSKDTLDVLNGQPITVNVQFGGREDFLYKNISVIRPLQVILSNDIWWLIILLLIILIIILYYYYRKRKSRNKKPRKASRYKRVRRRR